MICLATHHNASQRWSDDMFSGVVDGVAVNMGRTMVVQSKATQVC